MSKPLVTVAMLIYASSAYLEFVLNSLSTHSNDTCDVTYLVVANDPWPSVVNYFQSQRWIDFQATLNAPVRVVIHINEPKDPYWIQNVYAAWNRCLSECQTDLICFVNSDMAVTDNFLDNLLKFDLTKYVPTSRLVECGRMPSLPGLISKNFGQSLAELDITGFEKFASEVSEPFVSVVNGGFMPSLFRKDILQSIGGWHSNKNGIPGDQITMYLLNKHFGLQHIMVHDSIVMHWQRGESAEVNDLQ